MSLALPNRVDAPRRRKVNGAITESMAIGVT